MAYTPAPSGLVADHDRVLVDLDRGEFTFLLRGCVHSGRAEVTKSRGASGRVYKTLKLHRQGMTLRYLEELEHDDVNDLVRQLELGPADEQVDADRVRFVD